MQRLPHENNGKEKIDDWRKLHAKERRRATFIAMFERVQKRESDQNVFRLMQKRLKCQKTIKIIKALRTARHDNDRNVLKLLR